MKRTSYLFVYNSLRRDGHCRISSFFQSRSRFVGEGHLCGKLYLVGDYPGAVISDDQKDKVVGEVYQLPNFDHTIGVIDQFEGCSEEAAEPHEFMRTTAEIRMVSGRNLTAYVYLYAWPATGKRRINSGDFFKTHIDE